MRLRSIALLGAGGLALYRLAQQLGVPDGVTPVQPFQLSRYLGRWYEIARIDHVYERGLTDTSADYRLLPGGGVQVTNRGFHPRARRWREVRASARPVQDGDVAHLQVSFIWPVRASYIVFALDGDYQHALVSGPTHDYLWLLARTPQIRATARANMLDAARAAGFDVGRLMWVDQRRNVERARPLR
ncbi:lipocalin family protein [Ottowia testudinis]|uniref:Outer membrane lipoprotein Blc n=1 Tax=Ottowia testudinis TaxID=2816950 RepID=A0A975CGP0_9BURK|nr:lipocalin family protein [Ottowia testudinis]QTD46070.1 lipocalin family protein [Ottowia testudinis]